MKKGKLFFHPIDGSGLLTISWTSGPKGDAIEAKKGNGVGFFSDSGELLCVIFDEVQDFEDHQSVKFDRYFVEVFIKNGKISYSVNDIYSKIPSPKKRTQRKQSKNSKSIRQTKTKTHS
jgi:hypothetical protein